MIINLTTPELSTILAALRVRQIHLEQHSANPYIEDIATNDGTHEPLTIAQINALCERINCSPDEPELKCPECCRTNPEPR